MSFQDYWRSEPCRDLRRQIYQGDIDGPEEELTYRVKGAEKEKLLAAINEGAYDWSYNLSCKWAYERKQRGERLTEREAELALEWETKLAKKRGNQ